MTNEELYISLAKAIFRDPDTWVCVKDFVTYERIELIFKKYLEDNNLFGYPCVKKANMDKGIMAVSLFPEWFNLIYGDMLEMLTK